MKGSFNSDCRRTPEIEQQQQLLRTVDEEVTSLLNEIENRICAGRRFAVLVRGCSSLVETCNSLMRDAIENPVLRKVRCCMAPSFIMLNHVCLD